MGENLETVAARHGDKRDASRVRGARGECRRRRYRNHNRRAERGRFLNHFDRHPAGQQHHAGRTGNALARERASELVERVVPADIFAHRGKAGAHLPKARG